MAAKTNVTSLSCNWRWQCPVCNATAAGDPYDYGVMPLGLNQMSDMADDSAAAHAAASPSCNSSTLTFALTTFQVNLS